MSVNVCVTLAGVFCGNILIKARADCCVKDVQKDCICILIQKGFSVYFLPIFLLKLSFEVAIEHARA